MLEIKPTLGITTMVNRARNITLPEILQNLVTHISSFWGSVYLFLLYSVQHFPMSYHFGNWRYHYYKLPFHYKIRQISPNSTTFFSVYKISEWFADQENQSAQNEIVLYFSLSGRYLLTLIYQFCADSIRRGMDWSYKGIKLFDKTIESSIYSKCVCVFNTFNSMNCL